CALQTPYPDSDPDDEGGFVCIDHGLGDGVSYGIANADSPCTISDSAETRTYTSFKCFACGLTQNAAMYGPKPRQPTLCVSDATHCARPQAPVVHLPLSYAVDRDSLFGSLELLPDTFFPHDASLTVLAELPRAE